MYYQHKAIDSSNGSDLFFHLIHLFNFYQKSITDIFPFKFSLLRLRLRRRRSVLAFGERNSAHLFSFALLACHSPVHLRLRRSPKARDSVQGALSRKRRVLERCAERLGARVTLSLGDTRDSVTREIRCTAFGEEGAQAVCARLRREELGASLENSSLRRRRSLGESFGAQR